MRDLALVAVMLFFLPVSLRFPAAGALCWAWFSIMNPQRQLYGFAFGQPFNSVIAAATLVGWLISREPKRWPNDGLGWMLLIFMAWATLTTALAPFPSYSWVFWDRVIRILALILLALFVLNTKARIHAMVWVIVISLGFYGVKGGVFTIAQGGSSIVFGPPDSVYGDNNHLALAVITEMPLLFYLWKHTQRLALQIAMLAAMALQVIMVFGSHSRGGALALAMMGFLLWLRSDRKILYAIGALAIAGVSLNLMPASYFERLNTVNSLSSDDSFQGRINAWIVAYNYATEHFPLGAGFFALQIRSIFQHYLPGEYPHAAHSIYFQILGEHGYIGLFIYLIILIIPLRNAGIIRRQTRDRPELAWARDLADMSRVALISFYFGALALSMAYADEYLLIIAILSTLRELTNPNRVTAQVANRPTLALSPDLLDRLPPYPEAARPDPLRPAAGAMRMESPGGSSSRSA